MDQSATSPEAHSSNGILKTWVVLILLSLMIAVHTWVVVYWFVMLYLVSSIPPNIGEGAIVFALTFSSAMIQIAMYVGIPVFLIALIALRRPILRQNLTTKTAFVLVGKSFVFLILALGIYFTIFASGQDPTYIIDSIVISIGYIASLIWLYKQFQQKRS